MRERRAGSWISDDRTGDLVKFDITESVKRFASGTAVNYGFIMVAADPDGSQPKVPTSPPVVVVCTGP